MDNAINSLGFYLLRNPLLPISDLAAINQAIKSHANDRDFFEQAIREKFSSPLLQEALYIASPELYQEFSKWFFQKSLAVSKNTDALLLTLYKYYSRMCTRCTPYGLFAGCSVGTWTHTSSEISFSSTNKYHKHSRLDMNYVAEMSSYITALPHIKKQLRFYPNTSLYSIGNQLRYVEFELVNKFRTYQLSSIEKMPYLLRLLEKAQAGAYLENLITCLVDDQITYDAAEAFVNKVVQMQVLVSELEPTVTGEEFYRSLIRKLTTLQGTEKEVAILEHIQDQLEKQCHSIDKYLHIAQAINENFTSTGKKDLIQTDLFFTTEQNHLHTNVEKVLLDEINELSVLGRENTNSNLDAFVKSFREKYEQQEVPLLLALDAELGIGYAGVVSGQADYQPLVEQLQLPATIQALPVQWNTKERNKLNLFLQSTQAGRQVISLSEQDLAALGQGADDITLPESFYLFGTLLAQDFQQLDQGDFKFELTSCSGPSAVSLLGRFCHGNAELTSRVKECIAHEEAQKPDAIFAEVVHLPEARAGNILMRPALRTYEIPYLGHASVDVEYRIELQDLMVSVSNTNKIILRSKKYNKEVIPRLTSAHNYAKGLHVYRFLCDLQGYGQHTSIRWDWGILADQRFLPRVEYKHFILSKASWQLTVDDIPAFPDKYSELNQTEVSEQFSLLCKKRNLPNQVVLIEGDNELLLDLENVFCLRIIVEKLRKHGKVLLTESLLSPEKAFVPDQAGYYTNQVIIPLYPSQKQPGHSQTQQLSNNVHSENEVVVGSTLITDVPLLKRTFFPGSEWLYLKVYTGTKTADRILTQFLKPLMNELIDQQLIQKWFFIRYRDPEDHLRIRLYHPDFSHCQGIVLQKLYGLFEQLSQQGLIRKIQTDTYQREIERYGIRTMELTEELFFHDSQAVVDFLDLLDGDAGEKYRWLFALRGIDSLFDDFGYSDAERYRIIGQMRQNFFVEFKGNKGLTIQLNERYRKMSKDIRLFMDPIYDTMNEVEEAASVFKNRSIAIQSIISQIRELQTDHKDTFSIDRLLPSYIHMFVNRIMLSRQRLHELVLYHFLAKYYESILARQKTSTTAVTVY
ncbi:lantibiotic dehydratase [Cytophagaceae bacterium YF14B1]|uniref:Lantibiotic dehydratase n=1 Tax=Xanthocytophaga flava TaxID=3048013 RepID=A0AAE3QXY0_9BACT|nr:lantibiotic dehydratase [Xanthocytophaga flavus]MDJ1485600.1 lantibiotic dehydratase [Xanthocytophaga flavus]